MSRFHTARSAAACPPNRPHPRGACPSPPHALTSGQQRRLSRSHTASFCSGAPVSSRRRPRVARPTPTARRGVTRRVACSSPALPCSQVFDDKKQFGEWFETMLEDEEGDDDDMGGENSEARASPHLRLGPPLPRRIQLREGAGDFVGSRTLGGRQPDECFGEPLTPPPPPSLPLFTSCERSSRSWPRRRSWWWCTACTRSSCLSCSAARCETRQRLINPNHNPSPLCAQRRRTGGKAHRAQAWAPRILHDADLRTLSQALTRAGPHAGARRGGQAAAEGARGDQGAHDAVPEPDLQLGQGERSCCGVRNTMSTKSVCPR